MRAGARASCQMLEPACMEGEYALGMGGILSEPEAEFPPAPALPGCSGEELRERLRDALAGPVDVLPLPPVPLPPRPHGKGDRSRQRWRRAMRLREVAERVRHALDSMGIAQTSFAGQEVEVCRIRSAQADLPIREAWVRLLRESKRMVIARRLSLMRAATGAALFRQVVHREATEHYSRSHRMPIYVPFVADEVAEPPLGHTLVDMLSASEPADAECYGDRCF